MVIMAGGFGSRMHPHTEDYPKPMLKIDGSPCLNTLFEVRKQKDFMNSS